MDISVLFKIIVFLALAALLLSAECSPAGRRGKKEQKKVKHNKCSQRKARKLWLNMDSEIKNQLYTDQIPPNQSISPWTYEVSYDQSRIPSYIFEAKCDSAFCVNKDGIEDAGLESKPIFYQILVLRRVKHCSLKLETYTTSVGCTCVLANVVSHK